MLTDMMVTFAVVWPSAFILMTIVHFARSWNWSFDDSSDSTRFQPRLGRFGGLPLDATREEVDWQVRRLAAWWLKAGLVGNAIFLVVWAFMPGPPSHASVVSISLLSVNLGVSLTLLAVFRIAQSLAEATDRRLRELARPGRDESDG